MADIAAPAERGTYMGFVSAGPMLGPCIGYFIDILDLACLPAQVDLSLDLCLGD